MVRLYERWVRIFFALLLIGGLVAFSLEFAGVDVDECGHDPLTHAVVGDECHCLGQLLHSPFFQEKAFEVGHVPLCVGHLIPTTDLYHSAAPGDIPVPPA